MAIKKYEIFLKIIVYNVRVEPSGLLIDKINYVLGGIPDKKVYCDIQYGILEIKCPEE